MRFFSKLVVICNCCFIIAVILRVIENLHKKEAVFNGMIKLNPVESDFVVLGYSAILINFIFNVVMLILFMTKRKPIISIWIIRFNLLLLLLQIGYFLIGI
jgi:hypothetical protein